ncbi:hypothetical protein PUR61_17755 [Streptomyces sp. BE20]|uniref:hypothetical protein n=1 Tax=Streptomyces sp. BE20 TaxID=3002525 RepID=UPI002E76F67B|nr:hypothetical protein [Streptomyces sp. BE20]MEE1824020.1 hypothetical protein [Streptomyces sp. BE20]
MNDDGTGGRGGRSANRLVGLIHTHRDTVRERLGEELYAVLVVRVEALAAVAPDDEMGWRRALQGVRLALLPLPFDHPVRVSLDSFRQVAAPPGPASVAEVRELLAWLSAPAAGAADPGEAGRDGHPLLDAPSFSAAQARDRCGGPPPPELIRVPNARSGDRYPQFQFGADGGVPHRVVLEVNRLLLADVDPWGAGTWWLSENSWLGGVPASLLGRLPDHRLVGAATQLVEGE